MRTALLRLLTPHAALLLLTCVCLRPAHAQTVGKLRTISRDAYQAQLQQDRALLESCRADPHACDPKQVGDDRQVEASAGTPAFDARFDWLRATLDDAPKAKGPDRDKLLISAERRLQDDAADAGAYGQALPESQTDSEAKLQAVLAQRQFRHVEQTSWLQGILGNVELWFSRLFSGFRDLLPSSSWIGVAVEWGILALAAVGLGFWAWTTTRQQRVAIAAGPGSVQLWQVESERWAERAQAEAAREDWREAVHCLYWSAIVQLEGQRLWRPNRTRTPREYVCLLEPGSPRASSLGSLTRIFERIWYGLRAAERADYEQARGLLDQLRSA